MSFLGQAGHKELTLPRLSCAPWPDGGLEHMPKAGDPRARTSVTVPSAAPGDLPKNSFMLVLTGTRFGELYKLPTGRVVRIGRGEEADIRLDDEGISRLHCSLESRGPEAVLRDLGSQNGTYVGGERTHEKVLSDGDRVQIGAATTFKVAYADEVEVNYQRRLAEIALRDPLTGVYNRRHFGERLTSEFAASRRYGRSLSLVILDVDHLNRVNEAHGRPAGDEVLRGVAQVLQGIVRGADVVARVGGDEIAVTATFGIAVDVPSHKRENEQPRHLVEHAERAMERQKELGVNRTGN